MTRALVSILIIIFLQLPLARATTTCPAGTFLAEDNKCRKCRAGTVREPASELEDQCRRCDFGFFQDQPGQRECKPCPPGTISTRTGKRCRRCTGGRVPFSGFVCICTGETVLRNKRCVPCPPKAVFFRPAKFAPGLSPLASIPNRGICFRCKSGFVVVPNSLTTNATCGLCPKGWTASRKEPICQRCPRNTFKPEEGQRSCLKCPDGTSSEKGASECIICPPGTFRSATAIGPFDSLAVCLKCPRGTFQTCPGISRTCTECPPGTTSEPGAVSCS